jgi:hypothetical protein
MMTRIPLIHSLQNAVRLMNGNNRSLRQNFEMSIGYYGCDLDDLIALRFQPGHLEVNPDQIRFGLRHFILRASRASNMR